MSEGGEKTEAPTQKRRDKAREDGQILRSRDLAAALVMMAGIAWLMFAGPTLLGACKAVMATSFQFTHADVEDFEPFRPLLEAGASCGPRSPRCSRSRSSRPSRRRRASARSSSIPRRWRPSRPS
ncbi:hypothetical protein GCM10020258_21600 [Sphingomonas yabuuchiae]